MAADNMKREVIVTKSSNSNTQNDIGEHKTEPCNNPPDLPFDITVEIISRLHVKLIVACKSLSKAFKNLISDPSFSLIYHTNNKSNSFHTIIGDDKKSNCSFHLVEVDKREISKENGNYRFCNSGIFNTKRLPGGSRSAYELFSIFGYCNGIFCLVVVKLGFYNLFVINPLLGKFIQLPKPVVHVNDKTFLSFGIGYCQITNRFKVVRFITEDLGGDDYKSNCEIFTIGYNQNWRSHGNVIPPPRHIFLKSTQPRSAMVPFLSALHWIMSPINSFTRLQPRKFHICAFDMTEEKVSALLPLPEVDGGNIYGQLCVLSEKLCLYRHWDFELLVMNEYGVEGSWTKQSVLNKSSLPTDIKRFVLMPSIVLPEGVIVLCDGHKLVFYDMKKEKCLCIIHQLIQVYQPNQVYYPIPFVPNFVPLRNLVQGPGLMVDVQSCSLVSEAPQALPGDRMD